MELGRKQLKACRSSGVSFYQNSNETLKGIWPHNTLEQHQQQKRSRVFIWSELTPGGRHAFNRFLPSSIAPLHFIKRDKGF